MTSHVHGNWLSSVNMSPGEMCRWDRQI